MSHFRKVQQQSLLDLIPRVDTLWNVDAIAKCLELIIEKFNISSFENLLDHSLADFSSVFLNLQILSNARMFKSDYKDKFMEFLMEPLAKDVFTIVQSADLFITKRSVAEQTNGVKKRKILLKASDDQAVDLHHLGYHVTDSAHTTTSTDTSKDGGYSSAVVENLTSVPSAKSSKEELLDRLVTNGSQKLQSTERVQMLFSSDMDSESFEHSIKDTESNSNFSVPAAELTQIFNKYTTRSHEEMVEHLRDTKATLKGILMNTMRQISKQIDTSFENTKHLLKTPNSELTTKDTHMSVLGSIYQELESKITPQFISQEFSNLFTEIQYSMADADGKSKLKTLPQPYKRIIEHQMNKS